MNKTCSAPNILESHDLFEQTQFVIDLTAINHNLKIIQNQLPNETELMLIVKASAYGTCAARIAQAVKHNYLGVAYVEEGVQLRRAGIEKRIFCLHATPKESETLIKYDLEVGVSNLQQIEALQQAAWSRGVKIPVHLHLNTGMGRFGCREDELELLASAILKSSALIPEGFMSHLSCPEDPMHADFTAQQIERFETAWKRVQSTGFHPRWVHLTNSSGIQHYSIPSCNLIRVGLALYGMQKNSLGLRPVFTLKTPIIAIQELKEGESVSYRRRYQVTGKSAQIAIVPIGYGDGLRRLFAEGGSFLINGKEAPVVGEICMDYTMIDITHLSGVSVGDEALLFGPERPIETIAAQNRIIIHELIAGLGPRVRRHFLSAE